MSAPNGSPSRAVPALIGFVAMAVIAGVLVTVGVAPAIALTSVGAKNGIGLFEDLPSDLKIDPLQQASTLYARSHGKDVKIATFYSQNRQVVSSAELGTNAKVAAVAGEDVRFYQHGGVDPTGILRAAIQNATGKNLSGASTITQQLVKNVCEQNAATTISDPTKSIAAQHDCAALHLDRKLREMRYAIGLEKKYSKEQILTDYLNIALFGGRIYGIQAAAKYYYDVDAKDLSVSQAASLIAIVNSPNTLRIDDPDNIKANTARRNYILNVEYSYKMITKAQFTEAINTKVTPKITLTQSGCQAATNAGYFCDYVERVVEYSPAFGKTPTARLALLNAGGLKIYTSLNMDLQKKAQTTMDTYVPKDPSAGDLGGAATSVQVGTGRILTMVQSKNYGTSNPKTDSEVNYNVNEKYGESTGFQPGSTYKLFTLVDWLENGHGLNEVVPGKARTIPAGALTACGSPVNVPFDLNNDEGDSNVPVTVLRGTELSINGAFGSMAQQLDLCDIRDTAVKMGAERADGTPLSIVASSIIGVDEVTPLSMATAYATVAAQGKKCSPTAIDRVIQNNGKALALPKSDCAQVISKPVAVAAGYALHGVLTSGTASGDQAGNAYEMVKTGTADDAHFTWEVGGTTKVTTAVMVGNINGHTNLRAVYNFPYCGLSQRSTQAAIVRHCLWNSMVSANNAVYPAATSWPQVEAQYLYGKQTPVPNVSGMTITAAKAALAAAGFQTTVGKAVGSDVQQGQVAATSPAAGTQVSSGTSIELLPSTGVAASVIVPNVVGQALSAARGAIQSAGFTGGITENYVQGGAQCTIQAISPGVGTAVPSSTPITVNVFGNNGQCP